MIKHFCDCCGEELTHEAGMSNNRWAVSMPKPLGAYLSIESRGGHEICRHCVIDAINTLDDRKSSADAQYDMRLADAKARAMNPHEVTADELWLRDFMLRDEKPINGSGTG